MVLINKTGGIKDSGTSCRHVRMTFYYHGSVTISKTAAHCYQSVIIQLDDGWIEYFQKGEKLSTHICKALVFMESIIIQETGSILELSKSH
jgi:hypothetical protein